ncbi:MAG: peptide chain release factor 2 [Candidatus Omnitrophica bacterium]|nr:peptide chain release factor 2 [Candidatus Omnitrophota bacterium]
MLKELEDKINLISRRLEYLRGYFEIDNKIKRIEEINLEVSKPNFWHNQEYSGSLIKELKDLKSTLEDWQKIYKEYKEVEQLFALCKDEDKDLIHEIEKEADKILLELENLELKSFLNEEFDRNDAILSINAGAGGTESCDWAGMLLRMYLRWAEKRNYNTKLIDELRAEESGIKNATVLVEGLYAYGYLKAEKGVHRLVRISPFDANKRRHTSFASVDVIPQIQEDIDIQIKENDIKIETFRSSGPGGQHMQKTESAVRITHLPTGLVVTCQNERSQYQNKITALKILKSRLYDLQKQKNQEEILKYQGEKKRIEWGSQIRSYILHPYKLIKDHRTGFETTKVEEILDGEIEGFIQAYLKKQKTD